MKQVCTKMDIKSLKQETDILKNIKQTYYILQTITVPRVGQKPDNWIRCGFSLYN